MVETSGLAPELLLCLEYCYLSQHCEWYQIRVIKLYSIGLFAVAF